jgi:hypothetical protein
MTITIPYTPREAFRPFHARRQRWAVLVVHRRGGKTVAVVNDLIKRALLCTRPSPRFAYVAPTYAQAKDVAWMYLCQFAGPVPGVVISQSELSVTLPNGARIRLYGADNYERLRGIYLDGCVIDESADMAPQAWSEILRPALSDREGWCVWIGTPKGRDAFWRLWKDAQGREDTYSLLLPASRSGLLPESELADARRAMVAIQGEARGKAAYAQEFECSFDAPIPGAIYGEAVTAARAAGRVSDTVEAFAGFPVYTTFDLGAPVNTICWIWQVVGDRVKLLECLRGGDECATPAEWAARLKGKAHSYGGHFVPHDGETMWARLLREAGLKGVVCLPRPVDVWDNISDALTSFSRCWFSAKGCAWGLDSLEAYRAREEADGITIRNIPVHDWCLAAGTQVLTPAGWEEVQKISVHDEVLTPRGKRRVIRSGIVRVTDQWTNVKGIKCTPEHRFFTNRGLVQAGELSLRDKLWTRASLAPRILACLCAAFHFGCKAATTLATQGQEEGTSVQFSFTGLFTRLFMARFRQGMRFITSMRTLSIITRRIWPRCLSMSTVEGTSRSLASLVFVESAETPSAAISNSARDAARSVSGRTTRESSESAEPAYNLTVDVDECYFVRGQDGNAYLVSNSSHASTAFGYVHQAIRLGLCVDRSAMPAKPRLFAHEPRAITGLSSARKPRVLR